MARVLSYHFQIRIYKFNKTTSYYTKYFCSTENIAIWQHVPREIYWILVCCNSSFLPTKIRA